MKTLITLDNNNNVWTRQNTATDIAGLINAGTAKVYQCVECQPTTTQVHNIVISHIVDVEDVSE